MPESMSQKAAFRFYDLLWRFAIPCFGLNQRLAEGFRQRTFQRNKLPPAGLWIQAASVGESYLAGSIFQTLKPRYPLRVLLTSSTSQGEGILKRNLHDTASCNRAAKGSVAFFPFDSPSIMKKVVRSIQPKLMVLVESEMWPGLLRTLKGAGCKILIANGRITQRSLARYQLWPSLWPDLAPHKILAVSSDDARRFTKLFNTDNVEVMPNMKFDRLTCNIPCQRREKRIADIIRSETPFLVLGSVRQQEEACVAKIIRHVQKRLPQAVIGLFPKHMHRMGYWEKKLKGMDVPWVLRSKCENPAARGTIILWDVFGELTKAYELSKAAFVGGSLAPLGGQNFLEALMAGVRPVIGPFWHDFLWVGREVVEEQLIHIASDWEEVAHVLTEDVKRPQPRKKVRERGLEYVKDRQGGTAYVCWHIEKLLTEVTSGT